MTYSVLDVCRHVVNYSDSKGYAGMLNMKLQKILYFIQTYFLAAYNRPCFDMRTYTDTLCRLAEIDRLKPNWNGNGAETLNPDIRRRYTI